MRYKVSGVEIADQTSKILVRRILTKNSHYAECTVRSNKHPISFSINIRPQAASYEELEPVGDDEDGQGSDDDQDSVADKPNQPSLELLFELPDKYPDVKPLIQVLGSTNLDEDEVAELMSRVETKAEESLGCVMIFVLVSDIVEWLSTIAEREVVEIEMEKKRKLEELEAEEKRKAHGTQIGRAHV